MKGLNRMLDKAKQLQGINDFKVGLYSKKTMMVSHLLYGYDTQIFVVKKGLKDHISTSHSQSFKLC